MKKVHGVDKLLKKGVHSKVVAAAAAAVTQDIPTEAARLFTAAVRSRRNKHGIYSRMVLMSYDVQASRVEALLCNSNT